MYRPDSSYGHALLLFTGEQTEAAKIIISFNWLLFFTDDEDNEIVDGPQEQLPIHPVA